MTGEFIDFYGGPFSNFVGPAFVLPHPWDEGRTFKYKTVEHYFQAMKATSQGAHDFIAYSSGPYVAKRRGRSTELRADWEDVKYDVMLTGLREKFKNGTYAAFLLDTGDSILREDSPTDFVWGYRNGGLNLLGKALMQVREELREQFTGV